MQIDDDLAKAAFEKYLPCARAWARRSCRLSFWDKYTIGAKYLLRKGVLTILMSQKEINACTVKVKVMLTAKTVSGSFLFKNETTTTQPRLSHLVVQLFPHRCSAIRTLLAAAIAQ